MFYRQKQNGNLPRCHETIFRRQHQIQRRKWGGIFSNVFSTTRNERDFSPGNLVSRNPRSSSSPKILPGKLGSMESDNKNRPISPEQIGEVDADYNGKHFAGSQSYQQRIYRCKSLKIGKQKKGHLIGAPPSFPHPVLRCQ